ncbi:MAG TPA: cysteine hydrolase family protein [Gaiellaceae bacterium]
MTRVLWDVDTQVDFVRADGKLAVPDAEAAVPAMARLVGGWRDAGLVHVASADDHELTDDEISPEPDFRETYPPHCLRGTRGAGKVPETAQADPVPLALTPVPARWLEGREFLLLKKHFDVFTNPNADALLDLLDPGEVVVFGVATDVCDDAAIRGLVARGRTVTFVSEASRGLDAARTAACVEDWRGLGVRFASVDEVLADL